LLNHEFSVACISTCVEVSRENGAVPLHCVRAFVACSGVTFTENHFPPDGLHQTIKPGRILTVVLKAEELKVVLLYKANVAFGQHGVGRVSKHLQNFTFVVMCVICICFVPFTDRFFFNLLAPELFFF